MSLLSFGVLTAAGYLTIGAWIGYVWRKRSIRKYRALFERQFKMWLEK